MSRSLIISAALRHRARIPFYFQRLSGIVSGSPIVSVALKYCSRIPFSFQRLSGIVPRSLFLFSGFPPWCPNPLSFQLLSGNAPESPFLFDGSPASCPDPFSFRRLSSIVSGSPIIQRLFGIVPISLFFLVALWHCVWILFLFDGSPASCPDSLVIFLIYDLESFIFHLVLKLTTQSHLLIYGPKSFFPLRALSSQHRVVPFSFYDCNPVF